MLVLFIVLLLFILAVMAYSSYRIMIKGDYQFLVVFVLLFLPEYSVFLSLLYNYSHSLLLVKIFQLSKEVFILLGFFSYVLFHKNVIRQKFRFDLLSLLFLAFIVLSILFTIFPIGTAGTIQKVSYLRLIMIGPLFYFLGLQSTSEWVEKSNVLIIILIIGILASVIAVTERVAYTHLHQLIGFAEYNRAINETDPSGSYGLTWTFQAQFGVKRFASFFSNPLEMAASLLLCLAAVFSFFIHTKHRSNKFIFVFSYFVMVIGLVMTYSRASLVAFLGLMLFSVWLLRFYRLLLGFFLLMAMIFFYLLTNADEEVRYYVEDTLTFQNPSSVGHALEWFEAIESIIENPQGIGLATSGNAGGVVENEQIGGENQFLIYGVQLGVVGLVLYTLIYIQSIRVSIIAYRLADSFVDKCICFTAALTKFGLLLPLFTSNAELFGFVSYTSWWMVGYASAVKDDYLTIIK